MAKTKVADKMCIRCRQIKPVTEFYRNRGWTDQACCDMYCIECTRQLIVGKEAARKYFWENNR